MSWIRRLPHLAALVFLGTVFAWSATPFVASAAAPKAKGVINLNSKTFDSSLRDGNVWLVEFYAPW